MDIKSCYQLGAQLKEQGNLAEAERCFRAIVEHAPDLPDPHHSLGIVLQLQGRLAEAIRHYRTAIALDTCFVKAHYNLAMALWRSGSYQEALALVHRTLTLDPGHAEAHWLLGMLLLQTGDFCRGWQEYEWRWEVERFNTKRPEFGRPQWDGSPLAGRTLMIYMEQGRGDMIQFIRYAPLAAASGGRVVVCAVRELVSLLGAMEGVSQAVVREGPLPAFDVHIAALSLPHVLGTTLETIPNQVPYLRPDPAKVVKWRRMLAGDSAFRVGLVWRGSPLHQTDQDRSASLEAFSSLADLDGVSLYSLQVGPAAEEAASPPAGMRLTDLTDRLEDFSDTAALIANLDLIISVDTAVAHLGAALGKPVWTLLPFVPEWRWLVGRCDSPWYPTMRLFRQQSPGDWSGVIDRVREELARLLGSALFHKHRGIGFLQAGAAEEAVQAFSAAIALDPADAEAYSNLAVTLDSQKRYVEALAAYRAAIKHRPDFVQAFFNMGNTYRLLEKNSEARACYEKALTLSPGLIQAELCLAQIWKDEGNPKQARECLDRALVHNPGNAEVLHSLGETYQSEERFAEAIDAYSRALAVDPGHMKALNMLGSVFHLVGRLEAAEECYRKALDLKPGTLSVLNNLGALYQSQERFNESMSALRQAIAIDPSYADGHWNLALSLLALGEYREGWQEYEWRFKKSNPVQERHFFQPRWDGSPLQGRTILLHCEQGFGDTIQFIRYATLVARRGGNVIVECQTHALKRLVAGVEGVSAVVAATEPLPFFDVHVPLLSLPLIFDTTLADIPVKIPYLHADPDDLPVWKARMKSGNALKIGLVWSGRQNLVLNRKRACSLELFAPLAEIPNAIFYSLQIGDGVEQATAAPAGMKLVDLTAHISDFADTAALVANLDLVITIDTAVVHLAGAMGKPTWLLLHHFADWRWKTGRDDSLWYPGVRLFRQPKPGEWQEVIRSLSSELRRFLQITQSTEAGSLNQQADPGAIGCARTSSGSDMCVSQPKRPAEDLRIGLAWAGRRTHPHDYNRSCPLAAFSPLASFENATFYSLQVGDGAEQAGAPPPGMALKNFSKHIHGFEDTAALISALDLVISVDTSVAHLAGAMGAPIWLLLPEVADWRWMTGREDSPWYPSMRLFRQSKPGDWDGVMRSVAASLARFTPSTVSKSIDAHVGNDNEIYIRENNSLEQMIAGHRLSQGPVPSIPDLYLNMGTELALTGRHREAIPNYRKALELSPEHVQAHLNLAFSLLTLGFFQEGWQHHEWRHKLLDSPLPPWPLLTRSDFGVLSRGTTLLVHCEQGYGDTLQFMRYIPLLSDMGYHVTVTCQMELETLVGTVRGVSRVVPHGEMLPVCDFQVLLLTIPYLFNTVLDTIPATVPYLAPRMLKVAEWRSRL